MHLFPNNLQSAKRSWTYRMVWVLGLLVIGMGLNSTAMAAGCVHRTEGVSNSLDPFGKPLAGNVLKVYNGGEFHYYVLPEGKPCNGPGCKGTPPVNMSALPQVISTERSDLSFLSSIASVGAFLYCDRFVFWPTFRPISPVIDGLLRPPTV